MIIVPDLKYNLLSIPKILKYGCTMKVDKNELSLISKEGFHVVFNIVLNTNEVRLYCGYFKSKENEKSLTNVSKKQV